MTPTPIEDQLRRALEAAAPNETHVDRGLTDLQDRVAGGATAAPPQVHAPRLLPRRMLAIAAAIVLVGGIAAVVASRGDEPSTLTTEQPAPSATGWYIPRGLSDEWELTAAPIDTIRTAEPSPGGSTRQLVWSNRSGAVANDGAEPAAVTLYRAPSDSADVSDIFQDIPTEDQIPGINLGEGITATGGPAMFDLGGPPRTETIVAWQHDGYRSVVIGHGLSDREVIDAAHGITDAERLQDPPLDGFELIDEQVTAADGGVRIDVTLTNTRTGAVVGYVLGSPGSESLNTDAVPTEVELPGAPGHLLRTVVPSDGGDEAIVYLGRWPGADVSGGPDAASFVEDPGPVTDADVQEVLASLRPASADEWEAFLRTAPVPLANLESLRVASLADVVDRGTATSSGTTAVEDMTDEVTTTQFETTDTSVPSGYSATDLTLAPVLEVRACDEDPGFVGLVPDVDQEVCYRTGPTGADGLDLESAEAAEQEGWVVNVQARSASRDHINDLFNACFDGDDTCPPQSADGVGAVAIILEGQVISAPAVNGPDLADDAFTISTPGMTEQQASDLAAAINAG